MCYGDHSAPLSVGCSPLPQLPLHLRSKVRVLVDDIGRSMGELPPEVGAGALGRRLDYLGKLVRATVQAMAAPPAH